MKIALVRSPFIEIQTGIPIGLAYMQKAYKDLGHQVQLYDFSFDVTKHFNFTCGEFTRNFELKKQHPAYSYAFSQVGKYCDTLIKFNPDVIGFHLAYSTSEFSVAMAKHLKGKKNVRMIAGGPDTTNQIEKLQKEGLFDTLVVGYGEEAAARSLIEKGVLSTPLSKEKNYTPDYTGIEFTKYGGKYPVLTTRGCPNQCTFCSQRLRYYYHSIPSVIAQIKASPPNCTIIINDSNMNVNAARTKELFSAISQVIGKRKIHAFGFEINTKYDEYIREMAKCNFAEVRLGIESGSLRLRNEMKKPKFTNQLVRQTIRKLTALGITVWAQFIFCYPDETDADRVATLELMHQIHRENPKGKVRIYWFRFIVHHGTEEFFKQRYGVETPQGIRDWVSPRYNTNVVKSLADTLRRQLPPSAAIHL